GGLRAVARERGLLEVVARGLVVLVAMTVEPRPQDLVVGGRQMDVAVDHAERLEDDALADRRVALVDLQRESFAVEHLVVEPYAVQRLELIGVGLAPARGLEGLA